MTSPPTRESTMLLPFADWLPRQRWYAGRTRELREVRTEAVTALPDDMEHVLLDVRYADGGQDRYQVIVRWDAVPAGEYATAARIGAAEGRIGYDALYDEYADRRLLALVAAGTQIGDLRFRPEPGAVLPVGAPARVGDAEQSNTSVVFDNAAVMKVFRRVPAGVNPDLEINRALARAGCQNVARLLGAIEGVDADGQPLTLGMVSQYAQNSAEGWAMATTSARDLLNDRGRHADEVGGDFSAESFRLGQAVASVHRVLAQELGESTTLLPVNAMIERLDQTATAVPELTAYADEVRAVLRSGAGREIRVQRIHGDLHLGQVLRTPAGWLLIDFEGEPGWPIEERRRPDSPLRDVAGMLRSYEYAAYQLLVGLPAGEEENGLGERAREWIDRNQDAFCDGYTDVAGADPREEGAVMCAYELDRLAYEAAYEARHRPGWLRIPLKSLARLLG
jgi:maltokinase